MADTKISQLPAATTPLSGAEVVPLVQSGATVQTPVNEISLLTAATANTFTANQIISVTDNTNAALRVTQLGTGLALRIEDSTNPDSTPVVVDASGNVGIGTTSPSYKLEFELGALGTTAGDSLSALQLGCTSVNGDNLNFNKIRISNGASWETAGWRIQQQVDVTDQGYIQFNGTAAPSISFGSGTTEFLFIDSTGNVRVTGAGGLGYGTGSGGTVTQITSKTTGVTLNKTNGQIVTSNALMAGGAEITFTVTNSTVAATDTIILHRASGGGAGSVGYTVYVDSTAAGSFVVYIKNLSGTNKSEAITLNFAVIKAVTS